MVRTFILLALLLSACSAEKLVRLEQVEPKPVLLDEEAVFASADIRFESNAQILVYGAMLFIPIVDHSGSNYVDPYSTDPLATRRYDPLVELCEELERQNNPKIFSGLINFGTTALTRQAITNNMPTACSTLRTERTNKENMGWTNYLGALQVATEGLSSFLNSHQNDPQRYKVAVAFITDGEPRVLGTDGLTVVTQDSNQIRNRVIAMRDMVLGHSEIVEEFRFHTAYYDKDGARNANAAALLSAMAQDGRGTYVEFIRGEKLEVSAFLPPKLVRSHHVGQAWAMGQMAWEFENERATWKVDTDLDGISDAKEETLGCNPKSTDTNSNGLSDLVEFRAYGDCHGNRFPTCLYAVTLDSDSDMLTDCEESDLSRKLQLPLDRFNPISSDSLLPDLIAFRSNLFGRGSGQGDPDLDGVSSLRELSLWLPAFLPNTNLEWKGLVHDIEQTGLLEDGVKEYHWTIQKIPVLTTEQNDTIRLLVPQYLDGSVTPTLRVAEKKLSDLSVTFEPEDFH